MTTVHESTYTIGEVSARTGMTTHTLRFYEKEGLLREPVARDGSGRRRYTAAQVEWLAIGGRLRAAGMPLPEIRRYAAAGRDGGQAAEGQLALLRQHEQRIRSRLAALDDVLELVTAKISEHEASAAARANDTDDGVVRRSPEAIDSGDARGPLDTDRA